MKINNHIKNINQKGFTVVKSVLSNQEVKKLLSLVEKYYTKDAKSKNPTFLQHKNKDKTVYNLQYTIYQS